MGRRDAIREEFTLSRACREHGRTAEVQYAIPNTNDQILFTKPVLSVFMLSEVEVIEGYQRLTESREVAPQLKT